MRILLKLADYLDTTKVGEDADEDEEFEDCEGDDGMQDEQSNEAQVIDLDAQKQQCLMAVSGYLDHVLLRT